MKRVPRGRVLVAIVTLIALGAAAMALGGTAGAGPSTGAQDARGARHDDHSAR